VKHLLSKIIGLSVALVLTGTSSAKADILSTGSAPSNTTLCQQFQNLWPLADFPVTERAKVAPKMTFLFCDVYYPAAGRDSCLSGLSLCEKSDGDKAEGEVELPGEKVSRK
jgi:hypothetical protein